MNNNKRLAVCIVRRLEMKTIRRKEQTCLVVQCDEVMDGDSHIEIYASTRYFKIHMEGPQEGFFVAEQFTGEVVEDEIQELPVEVTDMFAIGRAIDADDIEALRGAIPIDDDNEPAPENIPTAVPGDNGECSYADAWGHSGICLRRTTMAVDNLPYFIGLTQSPTLVDYFEFLFPKEYLINVILNRINDNISDGKVSYGEFLRWIGCWYIMATITGPQRHEYWKQADISIFSGAPFRLSTVMTGKRFKSILCSIEYTTDNPPLYQDKFYRIRGIVDAWNANMAANFRSGWMNCLDESMMVWTSPFSCPGFMMVPRKPHPFGNEWHTICCGISGLLFRLELVEGKDSPPERDAPEHQDKGKTVGLLLRLTKELWGTGKVVVLDSGFCVLKALCELRKVGVFAAAVIKKRRYWPKHKPGEVIKEHFAGTTLGHADAITGTLDSVPFNIFAMQDVGYVTMFMSTYGTLEKKGKEARRFVMTRGTTEKKEFQYPEVIANHYKYRGLVDSHNAKRHAPISLETTWATKSWIHRVFAFLLAITEVNVFLAWKYFNNDPDKEYEGMLDFRKAFAEKLIYNDYLVKEAQASPESRRRSKRKTGTDDHELISLQKKTKFSKTLIVSSVANYPQFKCFGCERKVRTYCCCSPGTHRCIHCFAKHFASVDI
jgi:Transposase IS4